MLKSKAWVLCNTFLPNKKQEEYFKNNIDGDFFMRQGVKGHQKIQYLLTLKPSQIEKLLNSRVIIPKNENIYFEFAKSYLSTNKHFGNEWSSKDLRTRVDVIGYSKIKKKPLLLELKVSNTNNILRESHYQQLKRYKEILPKKLQRKFIIKIVLISLTKGEYKVFTFDEVERLFKKSNKR